METTATTASIATILVVDDVAANRALILATLEDAGHRVVEAANGTEALAAFERERPDCVLLDVRMPGLDGFEVCRRMHALPDGAAVPILFVTALRDIDTFDLAILAGGFDFLTKPLRPTELLVRVRAALALRRTSVERDDLSELLRHQRDDLMRAVLLNERLAAFLVHDLKNPVAGMQLGAQMIQRDPATSPRSREIADRIRGQAADVLRMLLNLLDISKGEEGQLVVARTATDLPTLVREVAERLGPRADERRVRIAVSCDVGTVRVDANLVRRVLENLLDNALRHAPPNSEIALRATAVGTDLEVRVADTGRGVPEPLRERIFDRFVQADGGANGSSRAGRGLGLAFCKLVVEAHDGRIWVEDASPGAIFCTRWPHVL